MTAALEIIPLHGFNADQERAFHTLRMARLAERQFAGRDRLGMRLSIDDPVRRVKAYFDRFWLVNLDEGIGARGFLFEDLVEVAVMQDARSPYAGAPYVAQVPIEWGPRQAGSVSAFDFVAHHQMRDVPVSVKSKDTGEPVAKLKPSTANVRQEKRMLVAAGYPAGSEWHTWIGSLGQMAVRGPFVHTLTAEDVTACNAEFEGVAAAFAHFAGVERRGRDVTTDPMWNDPSAWYRNFNLRTNSGAFQYTSLDADPEVEVRHRANMIARAEKKDAEREYERAKQAIERHVREQIALAQRQDPKARSVRAYSLDGKIVTYTLTANDQIRVTEKDAPSAGGVAA